MSPPPFVNDSVEALEPRRLLTSTLANGILTITGTSKRDLLIVTQDSANVFVNLNGASDGTFPAAQINSLSIDMAGGNDRTFMQNKGKLPLRIPASIMGSRGNDTLRGGQKNDSIFGGSGDDVLDGGAGADLLNGGDGFDTADYSSRVNSVVVNFDDQFNDGETKEDDNVQTDAVIGGSGDDDFIMDANDVGHDIHGGDGTDIVDYGNLNVAPSDFVKISLDDVQNDGVNGFDNIHIDVENVYGSKFADSIVGDSAPNILLGNDDNDSLEGAGGDDTLSGGAGEDTMLGQDGDDFFVNVNTSTQDNSDSDFINGGSQQGEQNFDQADPLDFVQGVNNDFDERTAGEPAPQSVKSADSIHVLGSAGPLNITGTSKADKIIINQNDTVISYVLNGVATTLDSSTVTNINVDCQGGNDTVVMSKGDGTNEVRVPTSVSGGNGNDQLKGGSNRDTLGGGNGNDLLVGNEGNDSLVGGLGSDNLIGGAGNDYMVGDTSASDTTGFGGDNFEGDAGNDTADYSTRTDNLAITMDDDAANDGGSSGAEGDNVHSDVENVFAGSGNDAIVGNANANFLAGGPGNDSLRGGAGLDKLIGGDGTDTLLGNQDIDLFFMSDSTRDNFDVALDSAGRPIVDFVNGDPTVDVSTVSGRALSTPT